MLHGKLPIRIIVAFAILFGLLSHIAPNRAKAERCALPTPDAVFRSATIIFKGKVVSTRLVIYARGKRDGKLVTFRTRETTYSVIKSWKGALNRNDYVKVRLHPLDNSRYVAVGHEDVIAAYLRNGHLYIPICGSYVSTPRHIEAFEEYAKGNNKNQ